MTQQRHTAPKAGTSMTRSFTLDRARMQVDEDARTIEVSFSSEEPVARYWGNEILSHDAGAMNLARLNSGGPVLLDHDRRDQIGVVVKARLDAQARKGRALLRFGKGARAQEVWGDIVDGIRSNVSVSYSLDEVVQEAGDGGDGVPTFRVKRWTPEEISIVSVPADTTVGVGRSQPNLPVTTTDPMRTKPPAGAAGADDNQPAPHGQRSSGPPKPDSTRRDIADVLKLYREHGIAEMDTDGSVQQWAIEQANPDAFGKWIAENRYRAEPLNLDPSVHSPKIGMSNKELRGYSMGELIRQLVAGKGVTGIYAEASRAHAQKTRREPNGVWIPEDVLRRDIPEVFGLSMAERRNMAATMMQQRALSAGSAADGGYTVKADFGQLIERLRNATILEKLGARRLPGLVGDLVIPRANGSAEAFWLGESETVSLSAPNFGQLTLSPKRLGAAVAVSKQLIVQSGISPAIENLITQDVLAVMDLEIDRAAICGTGAAAEPLGLLDTDGIGSFLFTTEPPRNVLTGAQLDVALANVMGSGAYVTTPTVAAALMNTAEDPGSGQFLWKGNLDEGILLGRPAYTSNQIPDDRMIYGVFNHLMVASWAGLDLLTDFFSLSLNAQVQIVVNQLVDVGVRHSGAFSASENSGAFYWELMQ